MIEKIKRLFKQPLSLGDITSDTNKQMDELLERVDAAMEEIGYA